MIGTRRVVVLTPQLPANRDETSDDMQQYHALNGKEVRAIPKGSSDMQRVAHVRGAEEGFVLEIMSREGSCP